MKILDIHILFMSNMIFNTHKKKQVSLGILRLDYDYPPSPGDIDCPETFDYDVYYRVIPGLTFSMCQSGNISESVKMRILDAVWWLNDIGVDGITGDCGFMIHIQEFVCKHTTKPVFLSALIQLPSIVKSYDKEKQIAIFTANGESLKKMKSLIYDLCDIDLDNNRLIFIGCENVNGFQAVALGEKVDTKIVEPNIVEKSREVLAKYPNIACILMECTELPPYSDAVRKETGIPVFDSITCANYFISSVKDNPRFGLNNWQHSWDKLQEAYSYGNNLSTQEKNVLVNPISSPPDEPRVLQSKSSDSLENDDSSCWWCM